MQLKIKSMMLCHLTLFQSGEAFQLKLLKKTESAEAPTKPLDPVESLKALFSEHIREASVEDLATKIRDLGLSPEALKKMSSALADSEAEAEKLKAAAILVQKNFRGHKGRKRVKEIKRAKEIQDKLAAVKEKQETLLEYKMNVWESDKDKKEKRLKRNELNKQIRDLKNHIRELKEEPESKWVKLHNGRSAGDKPRIQVNAVVRKVSHGELNLGQELKNKVMEALEPLGRDKRCSRRDLRKTLRKAGLTEPKIMQLCGVVTIRSPECIPRTLPEPVRRERNNRTGGTVERDSNVEVPVAVASANVPEPSDASPPSNSGASSSGSESNGARQLSRADEALTKHKERQEKARLRQLQQRLGPYKFKAQKITYRHR